MNQLDPVFAVLNSGWFALLSILVGVLGIGLSYIFYRRGRSTTELRDMLSEVEIIGKTPTEFSDGLEVRYEGQQVSQVTKTTYAIWNAGTTTLHGQDIVKKEPLRLELDGEGRILRADVDASTRSVNSGWVTLEEKLVKMGFDYLDAGDGFRITVLHSGQPNSLRSAGVIKGVPRGLLRHDPSRGFFIGMRIFTIAMLCIMVPTVAYVVWTIFYDLWTAGNWSAFAYLIGMFLILPVVASRFLIAKPGDERTISGMPNALSEGARFYEWPSTSSSPGSNPYGSD